MLFICVSRRSTTSIYISAIYISSSSSSFLDLSLAQFYLSEIVREVHLAAALALWV